MSHYFEALLQKHDQQTSKPNSTFCTRLFKPVVRYLQCKALPAALPRYPGYKDACHPGAAGDYSREEISRNVELFRHVYY